MKFRYVIVLAMIGLLGAAYLRQIELAYITVAAGCILYSLRCVEYQIGDLKGRIPTATRARRISDRDVLLKLAHHSDPLGLIGDTRDIFSGDKSKRQAG